MSKLVNSCRLPMETAEEIESSQQWWCPQRRLLKLALAVSLFLALFSTFSSRFTPTDQHDLLFENLRLSGSTIFVYRPRQPCSFPLVSVEWSKCFVYIQCVPTFFNRFSLYLENYSSKLVQTATFDAGNLVSCFIL